MSETAAEWCVNDFYSPNDKAALYEQVTRRYSCRRFLSAPSAAQWKALCAAAERLCPPKARLAPAMCAPGMFQTVSARMMKFENVQRYVAVISADGSPQSVLNAGVGGEMLLLEACRLGMAGVWVVSSYKKSDAAVPLAQGERLLAVIALGVPFEDAPAPERKRRPLAKLMANGEEPKYGLAHDVATAVRLAPSAMNLQPWKVSLGTDGSIALSVPLAALRLDLGIAAAHAMLALGVTPARFQLSGDDLTIRMKPAA